MNNAFKPQTAEDIENRIEHLRQSYAPEWKFDRQNPDIGTVIAQVFARQTEENNRLMSQMPERYHLEFVNMLDFSLHPAQPSASLVVFNIDGSVLPGSQVPKGTRLSAESDGTESGFVVFETDRNIYVTASNITNVMMTDLEDGTITPIFGNFETPEIVSRSSFVIDRDMDEIEDQEAVNELEEADRISNGVPPFTLFGEKETLGRSILILYHEYLFDGIDEDIYIRLVGDDQIRERIQSGELVFKYLTKKGFVPFDSMKVNEDGQTYTLRKSEKNQKIVAAEKTMSVVILESQKTMTDSLEITELTLSAASASRMPEYVGDDSMELEPRKFMPFTDTLSVYNECYIGHDPCFSKSGARITLNFHVNYYENHIKLTLEQEEAELKVIKRKPKKTALDFPAEVKVDEVIFEYYNGIGWKKLRCDTEYAGMFAQTEPGNYKLSFICPDDWESSENGPYSGRCIRMRIVRSDNCYLRPALHTYPLIENLTISYSYEGKFVPPTKAERIAATRKEDITAKLGDDRALTILSGSEYTEDALYIGLDRNLEEGPVSIYFQLADNNNQNGVKIRMEYSTINGFREMRFTDFTENFTRSGTMMFLPPADLAEYTLEGNRRYWIKIARAKSHGKEEPKLFLPHIVKLCLNAVTVTNVQTSEETDYYIDEVLPNMSFSLGSGNILDAEIWVNEMGLTRTEEMERMIEDTPERVRAEYDFLGRISAFYVLWSEVERFEAGGDRRAYRIDRMKGTVQFGDGKDSDIPLVTDDVAFKARVRATDGELGNLGEGDISYFLGSAPYIDNVYNPIRAHGGSNLETLNHAFWRGAGIMHSRGRLVSEGDYIRHVMEYSDSIDRTRVVIGSTIDGDYNPQNISIVLLMKDFADGAFSFHRIAAGLKKDLLENCEITVTEEKLHIVEPIFVDISVCVWAMVMDMNDSFEVQNEVKSAISEYLNPVAGETHDGWDIGIIPKESQILMRLGVLRSKTVIQRITMIAHYVDAEGEHELDTKDIQISPFMVCRSGNHRVIITNK